MWFQNWGRILSSESPGSEMKSPGGPGVIRSRWAGLVSQSPARPPLAASSLKIVLNSADSAGLNGNSVRRLAPNNASADFSGRMIGRAETKVLGVIHRFVKQAGDVMVVERIHSTSARTMPSHKTKRPQEAELVRNC